MAQQKNRKNLPSRHALLTTTEAPLTVHIPKQVADVSIQTVSVEEDDVISIQADAVEEMPFVRFTIRLRKFPLS